MNIRRAQVTTEGEKLFLRLEVGHATHPVVQWHELDAAMALHLSAELAKAAGRAEGADLITQAASRKLSVALAASAPLEDGLLIEAAAQSNSSEP